MTVDPRLQLTPGEYLIHPDGSASKVVDKRNMTVDEIMHGGEYTDRRGRRWTRSGYNTWTSPRPPRVSMLIDEWQMRLLIERDQHRDACEGLQTCKVHPVPNVTLYDTDFEVWPGWVVGVYMPDAFTTLPEAMDAARALAVGP